MVSISIGFLFKKRSTIPQFSDKSNFMSNQGARNSYKKEVGTNVVIVTEPKGYLAAMAGVDKM